MFQFIKANKMFSTVVAVTVILLLALCYGLAVRNVFAVVLGVTMLAGSVAFGVGAMVKEALFSK